MRQAQSNATVRILAIDDGLTSLHLLNAFPEPEFHILSATSGKQGLLLAERMQPDLILLEVHIPGEDGFETCRHLKGKPALRNIPVIFIISQTDIASEMHRLALSADDYLSKPIDSRIARLRISNALERGFLRQKIEAQQSALDAEVRQRDALDSRLRLASSVFAHTNDGITLCGLDGTIIDVNGAFSRITGYTREDSLGKPLSFLTSSTNQGRAYYAGMWQELGIHGYWQGEICTWRKDGEMYDAMLTINAVQGVAGNPESYVAVFSDVRKNHQYQPGIANFDALTNLPNRTLLSDRIRKTIARTLYREKQLAVVCIDIDGFQRINHLHGHAIGDQVLTKLAHRMKLVLREGDSIARLSGDEFAVLAEIDKQEDSTPILTRLLNAASQPIEVSGLTLKTSASMGVTFFPQPEEVDADQLLRQADQAMYQSKLAGKNRYHAFDSKQDRTVRGLYESLDHIRSALVRDELVLQYQPKVNMRLGKVVGVEALIRWQDPERGQIAPSVFLPIIEGHSLSVDIGDWVINTALAQMTQWRENGLTLPVSVNVGARQLQDENFVSKLTAQLATHPKVSPCDLELELLETSALEDMAGVSKIIEDCMRLGVQFSLDDFGTGYSSLTYLKRLPVSTLKIDQSFVRDMLTDPNDLAILDGIIGLARAFGKRVLAEGVETVEHGEMLLQLGCEYAQGYSVAQPMSAAQIASWVKSWQPPPSWIYQTKKT